jgi:hypothetical protein
MISSWRTCNSCSERCHSRREKTMILSTRLKNKKSGARRSSALSSIDASRTWRPRFKRSSGNQLWQTRSTVQRDHRSGLHCRLPDYPNNESQRISMIGRSNREAVNSSSKYPSINRSTTTKCVSSSSRHTPPQPDFSTVRPRGQTYETNRGSISNAPPPQKEYIHVQSAGYG